MRKGRLEVGFLDSVFFGGGGGNTQVKSRLKASVLTYIAIIWHILFPTIHTHCLLFLPHLVTELKITTNQRFRPNWGNDRPNFERCVCVDRPIFWKIRKKYWNTYTNHNLFTRRKVIPGRRVTRTAGSTLSSVCMTKALPRLTELTAGQARRHGGGGGCVGCACRPPGAKKVRLMGS